MNYEHLKVEDTNSVASIILHDEGKGVLRKDNQRNYYRSLQEELIKKRLDSIDQSRQKA